MKALIRIFALALLIFNSIAALYGGSLLIIDPTGEELKLPLALLKYSPFQSFLMPGILLFIFIGVFSVVVSTLIINQNRRYPMFIVYQGIILAGWLMVQINILQMVNELHYLMGTVAILLIACGWFLNDPPSSKK